MISHLNSPLLLGFSVIEDLQAETISHIDPITGFPIEIAVREVEVARIARLLNGHSDDERHIITRPKTNLYGKREIGGFEPPRAQERLYTSSERITRVNPLGAASTDFAISPEFFSTLHYAHN